jgi:hypothetical protein
LIWRSRIGVAITSDVNMPWSAERVHDSPAGATLIPNQALTAALTIETQKKICQARRSRRVIFMPACGAAGRG